MAGTGRFRERAKTLWIRGMNSIGNTAANIANNTRQKVDEITLQNRRREVRTDVAGTVYALWLKGETFPEPVTKLLSEMKKLDEQLNDLREEKYAPAERKAEPEPDGQATADETETIHAETETAPAETESEPEEAGTLPEETETATEEPEVPAAAAVSGPAAVPDFSDTQVSAVQSEINGFFDEADSVENLAEKVNATLEHMSDRIRSFPAEKTAGTGENGTPE